MKILVFGKTGQVATELAKIAPEAQFLSRAEADLANPEACAALITASNADVVINAAAFTAVDQAEETPDLAMLINGRAPTAMAKAAAAKGIPLVHISTDYVFSGEGMQPWQPNHPTAPQGAYGHSKFTGEKGVQAAGGVHVILRTSWVVSAHGQNFVKTMLRLAETRPELGIVADQIGGPTPAASIAEAVLKIAKALVAKQGPSGTYHLSGAPDVSWAGFAREIFKQAGKPVHINEIPSSAYPTPATRPLNSRLDCQSLQQDFGIARPDWRAGLAHILSDLKAAP
ncbi:MAG: dTDP-4-dehydrorhamnose reductase [Rhodobacteraceae bacterium]|nr:dTDP-4-dehydrorhamnose reductase [Paracoccaceae bacterium]